MTSKIICIHSNDTEISKQTKKELLAKLINAGYIVEDELSEETELLICIGGDGVILDALHRFNFPRVPVIGVNTGHLGFFQEVESHTLDAFIKNYREGRYRLQPLSTVEGIVTFTDGSTIVINALNEWTEGCVLEPDARNGYGFLNDDYPGMDLSFADPSFLENYADRVKGLFITHAHEDHFGAIAQVWPKLNCPVYAMRFTAGLIRERLKEYHLDSEVPLFEVNDHPEIVLGDFDVRFVPVTHSVPETCALIIKTEKGTVVHATDWRFDDDKTDIVKTNYAELEKAAKDGVDIFVCDSTNVLVDKPQYSEFDVRQSLLNLVPLYKNGLIATCFASNLMRLESLVLAAEKAGRTPILVGRTLIKNMKIAKECGFFPNLPNVYDVKDAKDIPSDKAMYICTGSQGNYRSALCSIVKGEHNDVKLSKGDAIIFSSKIIPGNEDKIERMQESLMEQGVEVIREEEFLVHTSGHANRDDLKKMYELLKPKVLMPVHGDKRFVREHQRFAYALGIKQVELSRDGDLFCYKDGKMTWLENIPVDVLAVDRKQVVSLSSQVVRNRKRIAYNCSVFISVVFDRKWNLKDLQISSIDILEETAFKLLAEEIKEDIEKQIPKAVADYNYREQPIADFIRSRIRRKIHNATDIKPVTFFHMYVMGHQAVGEIDKPDESDSIQVLADN